MPLNRISTVAIVDDDPAVLESLEFMLQVAGYRVAAYGSAVLFIEDHMTRAACLILDLHMPQMTGLDLATRLRDEGRSIPILLVTGMPDSKVMADAARVGIEKVIEKPPTEDDLLSFVAAHVQEADQP